MHGHGHPPFWVAPAFGEPPVGALMAFAGRLGAAVPPGASPPSDSAPSDSAPGVTDPLEAWGWMLCDGRALSIYLYPELFAALDYLYGGSHDSFCIPDHRGLFWRGTDAGARVDPDLGQRIGPAGAHAANVAVGGVGSRQDFAVQTHEHIYLNAQTAAPPAPQGNAAGAPTGQQRLTQGGPTSSLSPPGNVKVSQNETRPLNVAVNYIIKFTCGLRPMPW